jgi:hypothetical protein
MFKIDFDIENEIYTVSEAGIVIESFVTLWDAMDYRASLIWERDNAFNDYGCEFDIEEY